MGYESNENEGEQEELMGIGAKAANVASFLTAGIVFDTLSYGIAFIVVARLLGPANLGIYAIAISVAGILTASSTFGVGLYFGNRIPALLRHHKKQEISKMFGDGFLAVFLIVAFMAAAGLLLSNTIANYIFHSSNYLYVYAFYITFLNLVFWKIYGTASYALVSLGDGKAAAISRITYSLGQATVSVTLVLLGYGVLGALFGLMFGSAAGALTGILLVRYHSKISFRLKGMKKRIKNMFTYSLPIAVSDVLGGVTPNLAIVLLGIFATASVVGNYNIAFKVTSIVSTMAATASLAILPAFSTVLSIRKNKDEFSNFHSYGLYTGLLFVTPAIVFLAVFSQAIILTVFPDYTNAYIFMSIMSIGILLQIFGTYAGFFMMSIRKVGKILMYSAATGAIGVVALFVLIPPFGALGAIAALYFISNIALDLFYFRELHNFGIRTKWAKIIRVFAANAALAALMATILLLNVSSTLKLIIGVATLMILYPPIAVIAHAVERSDIVQIRALARKIPAVGALIGYILAYAQVFMRD